MPPSGGILLVQLLDRFAAGSTVHSGLQGGVVQKPQQQFVHVTQALGGGVFGIDDADGPQP